MTDDDDLTQEINGNGGDDLVSPQDFTYEHPFEFELGGSIPNFTLRYETYGKLNADKSNSPCVVTSSSLSMVCFAFPKRYSMIQRIVPLSPFAVSRLIA